MAAEYLQLPLDEVYFVEVEHRDWGDSYVFARKGEYHSCAVQVPGLRVYQGSLPSAWSPPREAIPLLPLTAEAALEVGRVFVTDSLRLDARSLKDVSKPYSYGKGDQQIWNIDWLKQKGCVLVPGYIQARIKAATGEVLQAIGS